MSAPRHPAPSIGGMIANGITNAFVGFMAALCRWFEVTPDTLKRPGTRSNAPPPSGDIRSGW